jgi:hypothetical protein
MDFNCELPEGHNGPHRQTIEWVEDFGEPLDTLTDTKEGE